MHACRGFGTNVSHTLALPKSVLSSITATTALDTFKLGLFDKKKKEHRRAPHALVLVFFWHV